MLKKALLRALFGDQTIPPPTFHPRPLNNLTPCPFFEATPSHTPLLATPDLASSFHFLSSKIYSVYSNFIQTKVSLPQLSVKTVFFQLERKILGRHLTASVLHSARGSAPIPLLSANPFVSCPHFSQLVPTLMIAPYGGHIMASLFFRLIITLDAFSAVFRCYSLSNFSRFLSAACED